jgi:hypothetical protein
MFRNLKNQALLDSSSNLKQKTGYSETLNVSVDNLQANSARRLQVRLGPSFQIVYNFSFTENT